MIWLLVTMTLDGEFQTLAEVVSTLTALEQEFRSRRDRRCIFLTVYTMISVEMKRRIEAQLFLDNEWMTRYGVRFANYYRVALEAFERGGSPPRAWSIAFQTSASGSGLVLQDLLLGMNAHINYDLALVLNEIAIDPDRDRRRQDHNAVNAVLEAMTLAVEQRFIAEYAPGLAPFPHLLQGLEALAADFSVAVARDAAWEAAVALANATNDFERGLVRKFVDTRARLMARVLLAPNASPELFCALRNIEQGSDWTRWLDAAAHARTPRVPGQFL
jgi:hypothetical protein